MNIAKRTPCGLFVRAARHASTSAGAGSTSGQNSNVSSRDLREMAVADSMAKEEEELAKRKVIREVRNESVQKISTLNRSSVDILASRFAKLQAQLDTIPEAKVKQLDEELEEFLVQNMQIPYGEVFNHPWSVKPKASLATGNNDFSKNGTVESKNNDENNSSTKFRSTAGPGYLNKFPGLQPTPDYKPYSNQELYLRQLAHSRNSGALGSELTDVYKPNHDVKKPKDISDMTIALLMAAGCHLGHSVKSYRPLTQPFIYGEYDGIHIIDLHQTMSSLKRATKVIRTVAQQGGIILYVGTSGQWEQKRAIEEAANRSNGYYVSRRWLPGTITNFQEVTKQIKNGLRVEVNMADDNTNRELDADSYNTLLKPDLVVLLNPVENRNCIKECISARIPTIGLCDTNMEPSLMTYPIPCNDDLMRASSLMVGVLLRAAAEGVKERQAAFRGAK